MKIYTDLQQRYVKIPTIDSGSALSYPDPIFNQSGRKKYWTPDPNDECIRIYSRGCVRGPPIDSGNAGAQLAGEKVNSTLVIILYWCRTLFVG